MNTLTLLPLKAGELESVLADYFNKECAGTTQTFQETVLELNLDFQRWLSNTDGGGVPDSVRGLLSQSEWLSGIARDLRTTPASLYSRVIDGLRQSENSKRKAAVIASYLPLMVTLAREFNYSSAGIAKVINEFDGKTSLHWKSVDKVLRCLKLTRDMSKSSVADLLRADRTRSETEWADANVSVIAEVLSSDAIELELDIGASLRMLFAPDEFAVFIPYLQTLFYLCVITEYFDHPCEYLYTFKPRGRVANLVFDVFPSTVAPAGNPVLNNFKAIDRLSFDWSKSRDDNRSQAQALVDVVLALSSLSHSPRKLLARRIRAAIFRYIDIKTPQELVLEKVERFSEIAGFLSCAAEANTQTAGIIEQRVVDFVMAYNHLSEQWKSRGLGDPVNATNTSSKKLGDCDFQDIVRCQCAAAEAHGGKLTDIYVEDHLRTMRRNLSARLAEWELVSDVDQWHTKLFFIAHEIACATERPGGLPDRFEIEKITYAEFLAPIIEFDEGDDSDLVFLFNTWVIDILNKDNVPHRVKERFRDMRANG